MCFGVTKYLTSFNVIPEWKPWGTHNIVTYPRFQCPTFISLEMVSWKIILRFSDRAWSAWFALRKHWKVSCRCPGEDGRGHRDGNFNGVMLLAAYFSPEDLPGTGNEGHEGVVCWTEWYARHLGILASTVYEWQIPTRSSWGAPILSRLTRSSASAWHGLSCWNSWTTSPGEVRRLIKFDKVLLWMLLKWHFNSRKAWVKS